VEQMEQQHLETILVEHLLIGWLTEVAAITVEKFCSFILQL
jgi:hypothetical protein